MAGTGLHAYYLASVERRRCAGDRAGRLRAGLFDNYADQFDSHLVGALRYRRTAAGRSAGRQLRRRRALRSALDLGCGTGLCGPLVRPMVERLTGVDLSARMLDKARSLGVYDRLAQATSSSSWAPTTERCDLVVAADVFIYVGDLAPVFARLGRAMTGGVFCFSVESLEGAARPAPAAEPALRAFRALPRALGVAARLRGRHDAGRAGAGGPGPSGRGALRGPAQSARPGPAEAEFGK